MMVKPLNNGTLHITDDIVAMITESAVNEADGIAGVVSGVRDEFSRVVSRQPARGIEVDTQQGIVSITVKVAVVYGYEIREVCRMFQEKVKRDVEMMTGIEVEQVHVYVEQISA